MESVENTLLDLIVHLEDCHPDARARLRPEKPRVVAVTAGNDPSDGG